MHSRLSTIVHQAIVPTRAVAAGAADISLDRRLGMACGHAVVSAGAVAAGTRTIARDGLLRNSSGDSDQRSDTSEYDQSQHPIPQPSCEL